MPRWFFVANLGYVVMAFNFVTGIIPEWQARVQQYEVLLFSMILLAQIHRYRRAGQVQRQQLKWLLVGGVVGLLAYYRPLFLTMMNLPLGPELALVIDFSGRMILLLLPVPVLLAVTRARLYDVDLVLNRGLVFGTLTLVLGIVFVAVAVVVNSLLGRMFGASGNLGVALFASLMVIGGLFQPTRRFLRRNIDHYVFGLRFDLAELAKRRQMAEEILRVQGKPTQPVKVTGMLDGKTLGGYQVEGLLGRGGMGEVYLAKDGTGASFAIKMLPLALGDKPDMQQRFDREMRVLSSLRHANIVRVYTTGYDLNQNIPYFVMDYLPGQPLNELIRSVGRFPLSRVKPIIADVAAALDYIHYMGVVHRDVKPGNIFIEHDRAVLTDFGLARLSEGTQITSSGTLGTLDYIAPEQIHAARDVTFHADIYALGIVTFQMLTGELPFKGGIGQIVFAHLQQPPPDPRTLNLDIPENTAQAVLRALNKTPDDRFPSAGAFALAL